MANVFREFFGLRVKSEDLLDKAIEPISGAIIQGLFFEGRVNEMCEILVRARDGIYSPSELYPKRGQIVVVMENGHAWGRCECPPEFIIIKVPLLSTEVARLRAAVQLLDGVVIRKRRFRIGETLMAEAEAVGGILTVNTPKLNAAIIDLGAT